MLDAIDTVLLESTDYQPDLIVQATERVGSFLEVAERLAPNPEEGGPLHLQVVTAYEDAASGLFNAACGWYRTAGVCLRTALDDVILGFYYELCKTNAGEFEAILSGERRSDGIRSMLRALYGVTAEDCFEPKTGAFVRLYDQLSAYQHRLSNFALVDSTATVYRHEVLRRWFAELCAVCDLVWDSAVRIAGTSS